jgi:hypothetical protein
MHLGHLPRPLGIVAAMAPWRTEPIALAWTESSPCQHGATRTRRGRFAPEKRPRHTDRAQSLSGVDSVNLPGGQIQRLN